MQLLNVHDLSNLETGTPRQQAAYHAIQNSRILDLLQDFSPVLTGLIPLGLEEESTDLDVLVEAYDLDKFLLHAYRSLQQHVPLTIESLILDSVNTLIVTFRFEKVTFNIVAKPMPVHQTTPYRHMLAMSRLLAVGGDQMRKGIRELKAEGLKTEQAFATYLRIEGNPYEVLFEFERASEEAIRHILSK